ncbi:MAG: alanine racemase [Candidatus Dormibacteraeota bacterium]|nr:alanine racemase [Candidatus Dormibacteraeota bacterium]
MSGTAQSSRLLRWAEVDAGAMRHNAAQIRAILRESAQLLAMVKSDGYGHGAAIAAEAALAGGATWLGVYTPDEALSLRGAGFDCPMLVVGWSPPPTLRDLIDARVDVTVVDADGIRAARDAAEHAGDRVRVHVKLDSGLGRLGVRREGLEPVIAALRSSADRVQVAGIFTHFADAESDAGFTGEQHRRFLEAVEELRPVAPDALLHTCGSAAIIEFPEMHHDLVRLGIALYGCAPGAVDGAVALRPAMTVLARVAQVKTVDAGESVGYGRTWWARSRRRIATVAIGYGQGLPRALSNHGSLVIAGQRCPIAGVVNMDQVTVDVTDTGPVNTGDVALFFGEHQGVHLDPSEVAVLAGTIAHEILCRAGSHLPRLAATPRSSDG